MYKIVRDKQFSEKKEYIEMRKRYKWRVIDVQDLGKHVGAHIQTNAAILSGNQGFLFLLSPALILCLGSTPPILLMSDRRWKANLARVPEPTSLRENHVVNSFQDYTSTPQYFPG